MSATVTCSDWTDSRGTAHKGCGATLRWPTDQEKLISGSKKPVNPDGTPHKHNETPKAAPSTTTTSTTTKSAPVGKSWGDRPYYEGVEEVAMETSVESVNNYLKAGWVILRIAERQAYQNVPPMRLDTTANSSQLMATSEIVFVLGRRSN